MIIYLVNHKKVGMIFILMIKIILNGFILEIVRYFESGDLVLVRLDAQCLPAIVFNVSGLVMKFDSKLRLN